MADSDKEAFLAKSLILDGEDGINMTLKCSISGSFFFFQVHLNVNKYCDEFKAISGRILTS